MCLEIIGRASTKSLPKYEVCVEHEVIFRLLGHKFCGPTSHKISNKTSLGFRLRLEFDKNSRLVLVKIRFGKFGVVGWEWLVWFGRFGFVGWVL